MSAGYVIAISRKEAEGIAIDRPELVHTTMKSAQEHLAYVKSPPTDPHYGNQYRIYKFKANELELWEQCRQKLTGPSA